MVLAHGPFSGGAELSTVYAGEDRLACPKDVINPLQDPYKRIEVLAYRSTRL